MSHYGMLAGAAALSVFTLAQPASALTMRECSAKYKSAQEAGVVGSMNWNDFRSAECGHGATMALKKAKATPSTAEAGPSMKECSANYKAAKDAGTLGGMSWNEFRSAGCVPKTAAAPQPAAKEQTSRVAPAAGGAKVSERECSLRYQAAKDTGTLGGMSWNEFRSAGCVAKTAAAPYSEAKEQTSRAAPAEGGAKVSEQECSARYQAAKSDGVLGGMSWNEFRKAGCPIAIVKQSGSMLPTLGAIFPATVARKYAGMHAGKARRLTCRDQYRANKAAGITQLKWTVKGGGYYSECNRRLKQQ